MIMPLSIAMFLALITLWFLYKEEFKKAKFYLTACAVWILLITTSPVANFLLRPLVLQYPPLTNIPNNVNYILLLGGDREKRTWEAIRLYQKNKNLKIITSGYSVHGASDAEITAKLLEDSGVKKEQIFMQKDAKDTKEEVLALKKRLGNKPFILVTSAYHMPRAMKLFKKEGLTPIAAPTNYNEIYDRGILQGIQLRKTENALHEYLGLLWLSIKG